MFARYLKIILSVTETLNLPQLIKEEKMSNNKFLKKLLAIGVASVSAISVFGLAACNPDDGNDNGDGPNPGPGTPTQLATPSITLNSESKKITWNAIDHATGYKVYEKASTASSATEKTTVTACEYTITQTAVGSYDYYVVATSTSDDYSDSKNSNTVTYTVSEDTPPVQETVYDILAKDPKNIIAEDFSTTTSLELHEGYGTRGIYKNNEVAVIEGGAIKVEGSTESKVIVDFGYVTGEIKGYFEATLAGMGNSWTLFRIIGTDSAKTNSEIFGIRTDSKKFGYRIDGGSVEKSSLDSGDITCKVEYTVKDGKVTYKINDTTIANEVEIPGLSQVVGIEFVTSSDGAKKFTSIDNIAVVADELPVAEYAELQATRFEAKYSDLTDAELGDLSADVPVATHKNNIASATSYAEVDAAYKAGVSACDAQVLANAKAAAKSQITNYSEEGYTGAQLEALQAAKTTANANIDAATSVADVKAKLAEGKEALDAVEDDATAAVATITIQVVAVLEGELKNKIGELTTKSGVAVTVAQIEAACDLEGYSLKGFYEDQECTETPIEESYSKTSETELTVTIYAKVAELKLYQVTFDGKGGVSATGSFSTTGWTYTNKTGANITYKGTKYTTGVKLNSSGNLAIKLSNAAKITFYCTDASGIKVNGGDALAATAVANETGVYAVTYTFDAGDFTITRGASTEHVIFLLEVEEL